jgi:D-aspartate ligase
MTISQNSGSQREPEAWRRDNRYARVPSVGLVGARLPEVSRVLTLDPKGSGAPDRGPAVTVQNPVPERGTRLPDVLLTSADYLGTLAAVRSFGRAGVRCVVADGNRLGAASWSQFVARRLKCPPHAASEEFVEWLLAFGKTHPPHVLCATSDDSAWLYAKHRTELGQYFHMYLPSVEAVYAVLNKRRLYDVGQSVDVDLPRTWFPQSDADVQQVAQTARFPVLIKPLTQILHSTHAKGVIVDDPALLLKEFTTMSRELHGPELLAFDPTVVTPLVQEFQPEATQGIYSLSGFVDEFGTLFGVRGATKILQRPRRLGVGVCFERAEVKPALVDAIIRICRRVGYFGVFEVEFIHRDGKDLLIDFNPRFYGQMAFDIARGLPVPLMAYYAALGDGSALKQLADTAERQMNDDAVAVHCNRIEFEIMLRAQRLSGGFSAQDVKFWRSWYQEHRGRIVHPIFDKDDWKPFATEITRQLLDYVRHPRAFSRSTMARAVTLGFGLQQHYL